MGISKNAALYSSMMSRYPGGVCQSPATAAPWGVRKFAGLNIKCCVRTNKYDYIRNIKLVFRSSIVSFRTL